MRMELSSRAASCLPAAGREAPGICLMEIRTELRMGIKRRDKKGRARLRQDTGGLYAAF